MPVEEGQEPNTLTETDVSAYGVFDPTENLPSDSEGDSQEPTALYGSDGERLPSFDQRYAEDFEGLVFLGALTSRFEWLGHEFVIKTTTADDLLAVAQIIKPWQGTVGEARAYAIAMCAMSVVSIDGGELPIPVGSTTNDYAWAYQRFNYIKGRWFPPTIDKVYSEFLALEAKANAVVEAMEKASGPVGSTGGSNAASAGPSDKDF